MTKSKQKPLRKSRAGKLLKKRGSEREKRQQASNERPVVRKLASNERPVVRQLASNERPVVRQLASNEKPVVRLALPGWHWALHAKPTHSVSLSLPTETTRAAHFNPSPMSTEKEETNDSESKEIKVVRVKKKETGPCGWQTEREREEDVVGQRWGAPFRRAF